MSAQSPVGGPTAQPRKMCKACFAVIHPQAEICPKCGVRQFTPVSKAALLLLTFFLGGIGAHKFYVGKIGQGIFYLLFCWTGIPGFIALIEFIIYIFTDSETLQKRYSQNTRSAGVVAAVCVAGVMGFVAIMGIVAAIAIPNFVAYRSRAACQVVENEAQLAATAASQYFLETGNAQAPSAAQLQDAVNYTPRANVEIAVQGDSENFSVIAADRSGRCQNGQTYRLTMPRGQEGWQ